MTVDFSRLKLYSEKVLNHQADYRQKGALLMCNNMIMTNGASSSYYYTQVRFAGRYYRAQNLGERLKD